MQFEENLISEAKDINAERRRRRRDHHLISVPHADVGRYEASGWVLDRSLKTRARLRAPKKNFEMLEDEVWCLFADAGFTVLNKANFKIPLDRESSGRKSKQIDVFAKNSDVVLIIECKCRASWGYRSLSKDMAETNAYKSSMARTINTYFSDGPKPKILWLYCTRNIIWSETDMQAAESSNIKVITDNEISYYKSFIKHIGPAGQYQLMADFLEGQKIPALQDIKVPAVRGRIGKYTYYSFVASPSQILPISFVNHLALNHPDGRPAYQRMVKKTRLRKIGEFIDEGGYFPTNILLNFSQKCRFEHMFKLADGFPEKSKYGWLYLPDKYKSAWVIDGQHRLYGYSFAEKERWYDNLFILAFEQMDTRDEADLFITINREQKTVPRSIIESLHDDLKWGSDKPDDRLKALHSALIKKLNSDKSSPVFQRVSTEGVPQGELTCITIPEFSKGLKRARLLGYVSAGHLVPGPLSASDDTKTLKRAKKIIRSYLEQVATVSDPYWNLGKDGLVATNPGVRAYTLLLAEIIHFRYGESPDAPMQASNGEILDMTQKALQPLKGFFSSATIEQLKQMFGRKFGEGGVKEYFYNLCEIISGEIHGFGSEEFREHVQQKYDNRRHGADRVVAEIYRYVMDATHSDLVKIHGKDIQPSGEPAYFEFGVADKTAKAKAFQKQMDEKAERRREKFFYLDLIDMEKIIRQQENWDVLSKRFNIPMEGEKGKKYYLDWLKRFNNVRRIQAHQSSARTYSNDDYQFLSYLVKELNRRGGSITTF